MEEAPDKVPPCVLVIGDVMVDILVHPEGPVAVGADRRARIHASPGGSGANAAVWLAQQGVRTRLAGRVGRDDHALQTQLLAAAGVEPHLAADDLLPTGTLIALISPDGERSF
jgi:sugar/nucleoside kinase (ribokinase family)